MVNDRDAATRWLLAQVAQGQTVLFLGAGASLASTAPDGTAAPDAKSLAKAISEEFIHEYNDWSLATAASYAEALVGRAQVELFVRDQLKDLIPSQGLQTLATLPWRSIYTTNFDELLEEAYRLTSGPYNVRPIFTSRTPLRDMGPSEIAYYKLHGSISRAGEAEGHPVLTTEDMSQSREQGARLFRRLMDDLAEYTILYVGYGREDPEFHQIMTQVTNEMGGVENLRPSFALAPGYKDYHQRLWQSRKVNLIDQEAEQFIPWLAEQSSRIDVGPRGDKVRPIKFFGDKGSSELVAMVRAHFEVPGEEAVAGAPEFSSFFKGNRPAWGQLAGNCDAKRDLTDEVTLAAAEAEARGESGPMLILIRAEAGNGKTTMLRRAGLDLATVWNLPVLSLRDTASLEFEVVDAAARLTDQRLVVLVDDASDRAYELAAMLDSARRAKTRVTVITAGRTNELRARTAEIDLDVQVEVEPGFLSETEIAQVLQKLEEFGELGALAHLSPEQRSHEFRQRAERQLLVAMREATEGKQFDVIVQDEYDSIPAEEAKLAYLYISSLYQTKVPIRAGVLRRLLEVPFEEFQKRILEPSHGIIVEEEDPEGIVYRARHPVIAQIVVAHRLPTGADRLAMYTRMIDALDLGYEEDFTAFRRISRNRDLVEGLTSYDLKMEFYSACHRVNPEDPFVLQHWAIACMDEGRFGRAEELLNQARQLHPRDISIQHSIGMLSFRRYVAEKHGAWAELHFSRAEETFRRLIRRAPRHAAAYDSLARLFMERARSEKTAASVRWLGEGEEIIHQGLVHASERAELYGLQGKLNEQLGQIEEAEFAFRSALRERPDQLGTRALYTRFLIRTGKTGEAVLVAQEGARLAPLEPRAHHLVAVAMAADHQPQDAVSAQFRLSIEPLTTQYRSAVDYAAYLYLASRDELARELFESLRDLDIDRFERFQPRRPAFAKQEDLQTQGRVVKLVSRPWQTFGFISVEGHSLDAFFDGRRLSSGVATKIEEGMDVSLELRFNCEGVLATNLALV